MGIGESCATCSQAVDVGRFRLRVPAEVADPVVLVIDGDEEDVGFFGGVEEAAAEESAPEVAEARDATVRAMEDAEHGWQRAMDKIGERGGLTKGSDSRRRDD